MIATIHGTYTAVVIDFGRLNDFASPEWYVIPPVPTTAGPLAHLPISGCRGIAVGPTFHDLLAKRSITPVLSFRSCSR